MLYSLVLIIQPQTPNRLELAATGGVICNQSWLLQAYR